MGGLAHVMGCGYLALESWAGRVETLVVIIGETRTKYRVRLPNGSTDVVTLPGGRRRLIGAVSHLVPKYAIKRVGLGALLSAVT